MDGSIFLIRDIPPMGQGAGNKTYVEAADVFMIVAKDSSRMISLEANKAAFFFS